MNKPLKKFAAYSGERISLDEIDVETYITTDNLLQNKKGKVAAEKLPKQLAGNVTRFEKGDILIANIRPYLKKIWLAKYTGGSSADVLTLKVEDRFDSSFVYYALFRDEFFEHMMNGSKGTKMPRGDKNQILDFPIPNFNIQTQANISKVLSTLDAKIELNNKIDGELEAMAKLIYDYWFVQFDFPDENGKPYKSSGGKMVYNEELKREIPEGWENGVFDDLGQIVTGGTPSTKNSDYFTENCIAWISPKDLSNCNNKYIDRGATDITQLGLDKSSAKLMPKGSILLTTRAPIGYIGISLNEVCTNQGFKSIVPFDKFGSEYVYYTIKFNVPFLQRIGVGSTFKEISKEVFSKVKTILPTDEVLELFISKINPISGRIKIAEKENKELTELRDWLLPMLMNGQVNLGSSYEKEEEKLAIAAEPGLIYENDKLGIDALFETINYDYEIACIQLLTERRFGHTYGKKYVHKMFSNIEMLNSMPKFKELAFEEKGWGMFSKAIAKTIDAQKFVYFHRLDHGAQVLKVRPNATKEVTDWVAESENHDFVSQVDHMLNLYEKPLIHRDMDRIELLNTVLECIKELETDNLQAIRNKMANWVMDEEFNKTKAEKFNESETFHMIQFIKEVL